MGSRSGSNRNLSAGPFSNYYFFADAAGDNVVLVVERVPGLYVYLFWGISLVKAGTWTGGLYFGGSSDSYEASNTLGVNSPGWTETSPCPGSHEDINGYPAAFVRCDSDSFVGQWIGISESVNPLVGFTGRNGASSVFSSDQNHGAVSPTPSIPRYATATDSPADNPHQFQFQQTSQLDGRANLLPVLWWVGRDGSSGNAGGFSLIGSLPLIFFSNGVGNGFSSAGEYVIGPDTYKMFPNFAVLKV